MSKLHIADNFTLPLEAVTQTFAILAKRGVGKSYLASVMAEEMLKAGQQVIAIDPTGAWHGLRSSADGKAPGFPIVVLGGEQADVPLNESAGEVIAQAVVENRFSAILDLSLFRKGQVRRFLTPFLETLYRLNREPLHLFVDEADDVAPQKPFGDEAQLVGAMEDLVKRGRKKGIGCTLITQRPADLAKQVLTQCEVLVAMRVVHPRDIAAIKEWVNVHGDPDLAKEMIDGLPALPVGQAWFWSPGWLGEMRLAKVRRRETFDSSATPKVGEQPKKPRARAAVDIAALGRQITESAETARANDPKELRRRIADLEKQLAARPKDVPTVQVEKLVEVPVLKNGQLERTERILERVEQQGQKLLEEAAELRRLIEPARRPATSVPRPIAAPRPATASPQKAPQIIPNPSPPPDGEPNSGPEQRILDALAWLESIGVAEPEQPAAAFLAGYTVGGGAWNNPRGRLHTRGLIQYRPGNRLALTDAGRAAANVPASALTSEELQRKVMERLPGPERKILQVLLDAYPEPVEMDELARRSGYAEGGGAFNNPRGRLRTLGLIDYPEKGKAVALPLLFVG
jgi:hypothetical protein